MMKNMGYMPGMGLGKEGKWVVEFPNIKTQVTKEGLRFFEEYNGIKKNHGTLNGNFVKEGGDFPYNGFPKPWVGKDGRVYLGREMFFNEKLTFKEKPTMVIKQIQEEVDWVNYMEEDWFSRVRTKLPGTQEYIEIFAKTMEGDVCIANER